MSSLDYSSILPAASHQSLSDTVYDALKQSIFKGDLKEGFQLNERVIAQTMGISVTPVKDAIQKLEQEGLTVVVPRKGSYVAAQIMNSIKEIYMVRSALEGVATKLASLKATKEDVAALTEHMRQMEEATKRSDTEQLIVLNQGFHELIYQLCRNSYLLQQLKVIRSFEGFFQRQMLHSSTEELTRSFADHRKIYEAIASGDGDLAEAMSREHIHRTLQFIHDYMQQEGRVTGGE